MTDLVASLYSALEDPAGDYRLFWRCDQERDRPSSYSAVTTSWAVSSGPAMDARAARAGWAGREAFSRFLALSDAMVGKEGTR